MAKVKLTKEQAQAQKEGFLLKELCQHKGWVEVLLPRLELATRSALVDPRKFKNEKDYSFAQRTAWAGAQNVTELLNWIDSRVQEAEYLSEKEQGKIVDKVRESLR